MAKIYLHTTLHENTKTSQNWSNQVHNACWQLIHIQIFFKYNRQ